MKKRSEIKVVNWTSKNERNCGKIANEESFIAFKQEQEHFFFHQFVPKLWN